tara:strand:- start:2125 stop:3462 length:1338 start_codon:yes stop_codon:yes gene_type:complete
MFKKINNILDNFFLDFNSNSKKLFLIYGLYIIFISASSLLFAHLFSQKFDVMDNDFNIILKNISFEFGELIENLYLSKGYFHEVNGNKHYLKKLPAIPFLILFISKLTLNYYLVIIIKNLIIFTIYFFTTYYLLRNFVNNKIIFLILIVPTILPYNLSVALNYVYADSILAIFLPLLYLSLISQSKLKIIILSLILFVLYFSKSTMVFILFLIPFLVFILEKKYNFLTRIMPFIFVIFSICVWGFFGLSKTGTFPVGNKILSANAMGLSYVLNNDFKNYYPNKSTDLITNQLTSQIFYSEWDEFEHYDKRNKKYLKENFTSYLKDCFLKIKFIFFGIKRDSSFPDENGNLNNEIRISMIFNKIILNLSVLLSIFIFIKNLKNLNAYKDDFYFLIIVALGLLPHVIVWATSKHLIGVINISIIYLLILFQKDYIKKKINFSKKFRG